MPTTIDNLDPAQTAKYLSIAAAQRKRALIKFAADYGPTSTVAGECQAEVAELDAAIAKLLRDAAASPKLQGRK